MLSKRLFNLGNCNRILSFMRAASFCAKAATKYSENTSVYLLRSAVKTNPVLDFVMFDKQDIKWTYKEFDAFSTAFGYGLLEAGYQPGDKLVVWVDQTYSAEVAIAQFGAAKAGVTIVPFTGDSAEELGAVLSSSGAKGLLLSPYSDIEVGNQKRIDVLYKVLPELEKANTGDIVKNSKFPNLQQVIQVSQNTIRGAIKFKHALVYTRPSLSTYRFPGLSGSEPWIETYENGKSSGSLSHESLSAKSDKLSFPQRNEKLASVCIASPLDTPFGLSAFVESLRSQVYTVIPSTYNLSHIYNSVHYQKSNVLVCERDFYEAKPPAEKLADFKERIGGLETIYVNGGKGAKQSELFTHAKINAIDSSSKQSSK